jgi:dTDP-4-dehydrorhamnose 3,5-epimerase
MELTPDAKRAFHFQSYGPAPGGRGDAPVIQGVEVVELKRHADDGGSMTELARLTGAEPQALAGFTLRQVNYSEIEPGVIKAFHLHARQTDVWYVPPSDRVLVVLIDVRKGSGTEGARHRLMLGSGSSRLLRIPPGVAHGARNLGRATARIVYFTDVHFSPEPATCDEGRLPWDYAGPDVWEPARG